MPKYEVTITKSISVVVDVETRSQLNQEDALDRLSKRYSKALDAAVAVKKVGKRELRGKTDRAVDLIYSASPQFKDPPADEGVEETGGDVS